MKIYVDIVHIGQVFTCLGILHIVMHLLPFVRKKLKFWNKILKISKLAPSHKFSKCRNAPRFKSQLSDSSMFPFFCNLEPLHFIELNAFL